MKRVLIVDGSALVAENLRARLQPFAEIQWISEAAQVEAGLNQSWDLVICDASLGAWEGPQFWSRLKTKERPTFLYTDRSELVEGGTWSSSGVSKAFTRLQRADLVLATENLLSAGPSLTGTPPSFLLVKTRRRSAST